MRLHFHQAVRNMGCEEPNPLMRVCLPMFTFAFPEELFKFQYDNPAFEPLFQFPPTWASVHPISQTYVHWGLAPPDPLTEVF